MIDACSETVSFIEVMNVNFIELEHAVVKFHTKTDKWLLKKFFWITHFFLQISNCYFAIRYSCMTGQHICQVLP